MDEIDKYDKLLVEKRYGKAIGWIPGAVDRHTGKVNPQITQVYIGDNTVVSVFHIKPIYYETYDGHWRPISEITTYYGNHKIEFTKNWWKVHPRYMAWLEKRMRIINGKILIPSLFNIPSPYTGIIRELHQSLVPIKLGLTTSTFYPDPNVETTTVDGWVDRGNRSTWTDSRDTADGVGTNDSAVTIYCNAERETSSIYSVFRDFLLFDTAIIGSGSTISSATLDINTTDVGGSTGGTVFACLIQTSPASNTSLAIGDYDALTVNSPSEGATRITPNGSTGVKTFTLNATGQGWISKTGITKLGIRESYDVDNTTPSSIGRRYWGYDSADQTSTTDPKLVVVHTAASANSAFFNFF